MGRGGDGDAFLDVADLCVFVDVVGPDSRYTHWKQTVFYLDEPLTCKNGEEMTGNFSVTKNDRNKVHDGLCVVMVCLCSSISVFTTCEYVSVCVLPRRMWCGEWCY